MTDLDDNPNGFLKECQGPYGFLGVFEDDGETGYLYLYDSGKAGVLEHHWVYNRRSEETATEENTSVVWDGSERQFVVLINNIPRGAIRLIESPEPDPQV